MLAGLTIALVGGDQREVILCQALLEEGAQVLLCGFPHRPDLAGAAHVTLLVAATRADGMVVPLNGTDDAGYVKSKLDPTSPPLQLNDEVMRAMSGKPLLIGTARPTVQQLAQRYGVTVVQTGENDEIAILNSIPTAEGAIFRAMGELPITIHGSSCLVVGYGRCGATLARMLHALGASVTVAARNPAQLARAYEVGLNTVALNRLAEAAAKADCIFNTVPFLVVNAGVIERIPQHAVIIDIASAPGGTDFKAAEKRGIKAFLDLGIPGRVAPQTAGKVLARTIPHLLVDACQRPAKR